MIQPSQIETLTNLKRSAVRWIASHGLGSPEAEDIFQQAILKALATPTEVEEPEKVTSWFYQILRNTLTDEFRKNSAHKKKLEEYAFEVLPKLDPETESILCQCVKQLMTELPESERSILEKHFFEGKKFKELSKEFHQSEGSIRVKALRARQKLKESLKECCNITRIDQTDDCAC